MIPKKNTLGTKEFSRVIKKGNTFKHQGFTLKVLENRDKKTRIGVAPGKKLAEKSVKKSYYKRLLRHIIKKVLSDFQKNIDIILIAGEPIKKKKFEDLKKDAETLFKKAGII